MPMAALIGKELNIDFDVFVVRKIPSPFSKEVAIGATCDTGEYVLNHDSYVDKHYLEQALEATRKECVHRTQIYRKAHPPVNLEGILTNSYFLVH
jgi:predicted phosphoribosyltransferase